LTWSCNEPSENKDAASVQKIAFLDIPFSNAMDSAAANDKLIFIDAFADWCMPCRQMDRSVFTESSVAEYFNTHFISLQIDIEKEEGPAFSTIYNVSLLPTLLFIDNKGTVIYSAQGFKSPSGLLELAKKAQTLYQNKSAGNS